ncbi:MAG: hypothetical protein NUV57_04060 [archaeon]|nr:hypothetical protein [archaeon]
MVNMTLAVKEKTHAVIKRHPEIKWTEVARQAIEKKAALLESEKDEWRKYALKHALEDWDDADELIDY